MADLPKTEGHDKPTNFGGLYRRKKEVIDMAVKKKVAKKKVAKKAVKKVAKKAVKKVAKKKVAKKKK